MKVKIPVYIVATASKYIGDVEIEKAEDFEDAAYELWKQTNYADMQVFHNNDFDLGDCEINTHDIEGEFKYCKKEQESK